MGLNMHATIQQELQKEYKRVHTNTGSLATISSNSVPNSRPAQHALPAIKKKSKSVIKKLFKKRKEKKKSKPSPKQGEKNRSFCVGIADQIHP